MKLFTKLLLVFSISFFAYFLILLSTSSLSMNEFDGALRLLSHYYTSNRLIPYKDFGVVYPPGYFIMIGNLLKYTSIFQRNIVYTLFYIFVFYFYVKIFLKNVSGSKNVKRLKTSVFLISLTIITTHFFYYDLFSILIIPIFLIFLNSDNVKYRPIFYLFAFIIPFIRWDTALIILLVAVSDIFINLLLIKNKRISKIDIGIMSSIVLGFLFLYFYLLKLGVVLEAFDFIVNIPTFVIKPYRNLPIPPFKIRPFENMMFYTTSLLLIGYIIIFVNNIRKKTLVKFIKDTNQKALVISFLFILLLIPYSLGRISFQHTIPIWYLLITFFLIYDQKYSKFINVFIVLSFIPFITFYKNNFRLFIPKFDNSEIIYDQNTTECERYKGVFASSIFVGRTSYDYYEYNNVYLYYYYRNLIPATSYISDEPGIQDSCYYGIKIKEDLLTSKKPLLVFLATNPQLGFQNKKLLSCNKIEEYLTNNPYQVVGNCESYGFEYEIRLYQ